MRKSVLLKQQKVNKLKERLLQSKTVVSFDDLGLTVKESTELRVLLNNEGCQMEIYKNNISKRALELAGYGDIADEFTGKKVLVFSEDDPVAPARVIHTFAKKNKKVMMQVGIIEGKTASKAEVLSLATLPSYETLLTQLAAGLLMPVKELAVGLNMYLEQLEQQ